MSPSEDVKIINVLGHYLRKYGIQKWSKTKVCSFYEEFENEKKKSKKFLDLTKRGLEPQIFSNFPIHDLNFHGKEGTQDQIKTSF